MAGLGPGTTHTAVTQRCCAMTRASPCHRDSCEYRAHIHLTAMQCTVTRDTATCLLHADAHIAEGDFLAIDVDVARLCCSARCRLELELGADNFCHERLRRHLACTELAEACGSQQNHWMAHSRTSALGYPSPQAAAEDDWDSLIEHSVLRWASI